jgi:hypothetical protein
MDKIKEILKKTWEYVYGTKLGKLVASLVLAFTCFGLANIWDFMFYVGLVFMIYPIGLFLVMMAYAWVINPISDWKESHKAKAKANEKAPIIATPQIQSTALPTSAAVTQKIIEISSPGIEIKEVNTSPKKEVKKTPVKRKNESENKTKRKNNKK